MATPFKMKSSPTKGKLGDFFKSITKKATPETKVKRAKAKSTRKAGESQYQANIRAQREGNRAKQKRNKEDAAYYGSDADKKANSKANQKTGTSTTPKGGNTTTKTTTTTTKPKPAKVTGYENATSVNAMVKQRTIFEAKPENKGKRYPGQDEINKRLKKDPKKFN